jgi:hypothetical protein
LIRIGVVIPTDGDTANVDRLLRSLESGERLPDEIVIVDNALSGRNLDCNKGKLEAVRVLSLGAGHNVSAARNAGATALSTDVVLFVDDDNVAGPGLCSHLVELFETNPDIHAAGPLMRSLVTGKIWCAGVRRVLWTGQTIYVGFGEDEWDETWSRNSPELPNCFAVRCESFKSIGGFDSRLFPIHFEEADFAARFRKTYGSGLVIEPCAVVYHDAVPHVTAGSVLLRSLRRGGDERVRALSRSRILFFGLYQESKVQTLFKLCVVPLWAVLVSAEGMRQPAAWWERTRAVGQLWVGVVQGYARLLTTWAARSRTLGRSR